jgi:CheY-like chemotaxis protein
MTEWHSANNEFWKVPDTTMAGELILIVDDHELNLKLARMVLEAHGYQIQIATDGLQALNLLAEIRPQLVLLDIQLPGIDGFEVARRIRSNPATRDLKVVAVTAYALKGYEEQARLAGCDGFITKPINTTQLPLQVRRYIDQVDPGS